MPRLYRNLSRETLERLMGLPQAAQFAIGKRYDELPVLLDPSVSPDDPTRPWLDWLGAVVAADLDAAWPTARRRRIVAEAFARHRRRGTVEGLRQAVRDVIGDRFVRITEPDAASGSWWLGEGAALGITTSLAAGPLGGAVLDTTANLDASALGDEPLVAASAGERGVTVCVEVFAANVPAGPVRRALEAAVARETPAHVASHLCLIGPGLRIGHQARVGIDTILSTTDALCEGRAALGAVALAAFPRCTGAVGVSHVGADTRLA
jgi:phage tail-like protein